MRKLVLLMCLLFPGLASATTRYVDSTAGACTGNYSIASRNCTGSDGNSYATIAAGIAATAAGDTLNIRAGTYVECIDNTIVTGSSGSPITIGGYLSETVILRPTSCGSGRVFNMNSAARQYITIQKLILDAVNLNSDALQIHGATTQGGFAMDHITLSNITTRNHYKGNGINVGPNVSFVTIQNSTIEGHGSRTCTGSDQEGHGIYFDVKDSTLTGTTIDDVCSYGVHQYSGYAWWSPDRNVITKNTISDFGRNQTAAASNSRGIIANGSDNLIANNKVFRGPMGMGTNAGSNNKFYNNTIYATNESAGNYGFYFPNGGNHQVRNNIIRLSGTHLGISTGLTCSNNLGLTSGCVNSAEVNPLFTDPANGDFTLTSGSPALDAGVTLSTDVPTDFAGTARPQGLAYDIGAYEKADAGGDTLTLLNPNGGTLGATGSSQTFTWGATGSIANVSLKYDAANDGVFETTLSASTTNDGSFAFTAPAATTTGRFQVCDASDGSPCDVSDSNVTITASAGGTFTKIISDNTTGSFIGEITGTSDAQIYQGNPTNNDGSITYTNVSKPSASTHVHTLVKFDGISQIPTAAVLTSVTLGIDLLDGSGASAQTLDVRQLLRDWSESQATWNVYSTGNSWTTAGGLGAATDRVSTAVAQITGVTITPGFYSVTQTSGGLFDLVQNWIDHDTANYGLHIERNGAGDDGAYRAFATSEGTDGLRPYLSVTYTYTAGALTLTSPTATSHFFPGQSMPIRWTSSGLTGNIQAEISRNNGTTYEATPIIASHPYDQADAVWPVTGPACTQCIIRLSSLQDPSVTALSPTFKIAGTSLGILP